MIGRIMEFLGRRGFLAIQCVLLAIAAVGILSMVSPDRNRIRQLNEIALLSLKPSIEYTLVSGDTRYLDETTDALLKGTPIMGIVIRDGHGLGFKRRESSPDWHSELSTRSSLRVGGKPIQVQVSVDRWAVTPGLNIYMLLIVLASLIGSFLTAISLWSRKKLRKQNFDGLIRLATETGEPDALPTVDPELSRLRDVILSLQGRLHAQKEKLEQERDRSLAELYDRIDEISKTNLKLKQEQERAEEASREKSVFLANISHELRTPLNAIIGVSEHLAQKKPGNHEVELILDSSRHLLSLIDQILLANSATASKPKLERHNIHDLVQSVMDVLEQDAYLKNLWFIYDPIEDIEWVETDALRFRQIITNLLSNAIKYTLKGGVTIQISLEEDALAIKVTDTGPGISEKDLIRLLQPFSRRENEFREGFGLGLYIAHSLCESLGYELRYTSNPVGGSILSVIIPSEYYSRNSSYDPRSPWQKSAAIVCDTRYRIFHLPHEVSVFQISDIKENEIRNGPVSVLIEHPDTLQHSWPAFLQREGIELYTPFMRESSQVFPQENSRLHINHITRLFSRSDKPRNEMPRSGDDPMLSIESIGHPWSGLNCLAADDNPANLEVLRLLLQEEGLELITTESGRNLAYRIAECAADMAMIDGHMPDMDPIDVATYIRQRSPLTRIIFVSADMYLSDKIPGHLHDGFIGKPVTREVLRGTLQNNIAACFEPGNISNITSYHSKTVRRIYQLSLDELRRAHELLDSSEKLSTSSFAEIAHRLNGTGRYCGGTRLIELCLQVEELQQEDEELLEKGINSSRAILSREIRRLLSRIELEIEQLDQYEGEAESI